jgi:ankyrin repeat protein
MNDCQFGSQGGWHGGALTTASAYGMENIVVLLLEQGADINVRGGRYNFALHTALAKKKDKIARLLIDNEANVNLQVSYILENDPQLTCDRVSTVEH